MSSLKKPNHGIDINGPLVVGQTIEGITNGRPMIVEVTHPQHVTLNGIVRKFGAEGSVLFDEKDEKDQPLRGVGFFSISQARDYQVLKRMLPLWRLHILAAEAFQQIVNQVRTGSGGIEFTRRAVEEQGIQYEDWETQMRLARHRRLRPTYLL